MTNWIRRANCLESMINGRVYQIKKHGLGYLLYCEGELVDSGPPYYTIADAKTAAEAHAATPAPAKQGVHIDDVAGQQLIDILKRSFTTARIQDFIDASPYDEPDTGAPEGGPLG